MDDERISPLPEVGHFVKVLIGSIGTSFILGMVFWAGATYNRILAIETHLGSIDLAISKIGDIQVMQVRQDENERRLQRLEEYQRKKE